MYKLYNHWLLWIQFLFSLIYQHTDMKNDTSCVCMSAHMQMYNAVEALELAEAIPPQDVKITNIIQGS